MKGGNYVCLFVIVLDLVKTINLSVSTIIETMDCQDGDNNVIDLFIVIFFYDKK